MARAVARRGGVGRRPSSTRRSMTTRSRSGSIAGFVTWAKAWRRWSATGRSRRPRPAVGVSSPMLQSGSCAFERHRLDVEARPFGVQPGQVAQGVGGGTQSSPRRRAAATARSSWIGRGASWIGIVRRTPCLRVGVLEDRAAAAARRAGAGPGPRRPRRTVSAAVNGTAPASDATATSRSRRHREGRRSQPVPVHQRADPAGRRRRRWRPGRPMARGTRPSGGAAWRHADAARGAAPSASGIAVEQRGGQRPSRSSSAARAPRRATANPSRPATGAGRPPAARGDRRSRPASRRPAADLLAVAADRVDLAVVRDGAERLGQPPDRVGVGRVALVEDRIADGQRRPAGPGRGRAADRR